jgi:hypothetical protein
MEQAEAQKQKIKEIVIVVSKSPDLAFVLVNHDFDIYCIQHSSITWYLLSCYLKSRRRLSVLYENDLD